MGLSMIQFNGVCFGYPGRADLFKDLSFKLESGGFYLVKGDSGTGKSTLLRLMNSLESPSAGEILLKDRSFRELNPVRLRRSILYIQQTPLMVNGSVRDNLMLPFGFKANQDLKPPDDQTLIKLMDRFSLAGLKLDHPGGTLSVGQQQRLCFIRGLLLSPDVILMDEPTSALDDASSSMVENHSEALCLDQEKTIVLVSHRAFDPKRIKPVVLEVSHGKVKKK